MSEETEYKWKCAICQKKKIVRDKNKGSDKVWENGEWIQDIVTLICSDCYITSYPEIKELFDKLISKKKEDYFTDHVVEKGDNLEFINWIRTYINWIYRDKNCGNYQCRNIQSNLNEWLIKEIKKYIFLKIVQDFNAKKDREAPVSRTDEVSK